MLEIRQTETFRKWVKHLKDPGARARINVRIRRLSLGNPGDTKSVGEGLFELRIDYGPGYRVYYAERDSHLVLLLVGGDKRTQEKDIQNAKQLMRNIEAKNE